MYIEVYSLCHRGMVRPKNQDNLLCFDTLADIQESEFNHCGVYSTYSPSLFGVFDGMGGHLCGEKASEIAATTAKKMSQNYEGGNPEKLLADICQRSNEIICDEMTNVVKGRMGSTASMVLFEKNRFQLCNLGDSPVFLVKDNGIKRISCEHTERQNYERIFGKNYEKNKKFRLTQHLGIFPDEMEISPYFATDTIESGDIFLLCSDGLTDMVELDEILNIILKSDSVKSAGEKLLSVALANGGKDNITIIIGKVIEENNNSQNKSCQNDISKNKKRKISPIFILCAIVFLIVALTVGSLIYMWNDKNKGDIRGNSLSEAISTLDEAFDIPQDFTKNVDAHK